MKFHLIKQQIIDEINKRWISNLGISEQVTLVDWIVNQPIYDELTGNVVIWWPAIPMIMLVGQTSARVYFFALKALLPNVEQGWMVK